MQSIELNLTEEEIKKVKYDIESGGVITDGCFCGEAISNFRDNLYLIIDFSCRKSSSCDNPYYQVTNITVTEKAADHYDKEKLNDLLKVLFDDDMDIEINKFDDREIVLSYDYNNRDATFENVYLVCEGLKFSDGSLKAIQKKLFKYYKKTYGQFSEAKFKDVGRYCY